MAKKRGRKQTSARANAPRPTLSLSLPQPSPKTAPFQSAMAALSIPGLLFALGAGLISQTFWGALILMTASIPLFWYMLYRAYGPDQRHKRYIGVAASLLMYGLMFWWIWVPYAVSVYVFPTPGNYADDKDVYGIKWKPNFSELVLILDNSKGENDFTQISMAVRTDLIISGFGVAPGIDTCSGERDMRNDPLTLSLDPANRNAPSEPILKNAMNGASVYRLKCERLSAGSRIEIRFPIEHPANSGRHQPSWVNIWFHLNAGQRPIRFLHPVCFVNSCRIPDTVDGRFVLSIPWWDVVGYVAFGQTALLSGLRLGSLQ